MKRIGRFSKSQGERDGEGENQDVSRKSLENKGLQPSRSNHSGESQDSLRELRPIFGGQNATTTAAAAAATATAIGMGMGMGMYDSSLNLNPSILNAPLESVLQTSQASALKGGNSLFSSKQSFSTKQSSYQNSAPHSKKSFGDFGQALQTLNIVEGSTASKEKDEGYSVVDELRQLSQDLAYIMHQLNNSSVNLSTAVMNLIDCFKSFSTSYRAVPPISAATKEKRTRTVGDAETEIETETISKNENKNENENENEFQTEVMAYNNLDLRKIIKIYLQYHDDLLQNEVYIKLKLLLMKHFNDFASKFDDEAKSSTVLIKPRYYAVGSGDHGPFPGEDSVATIMDRIAQVNLASKDQNGSFIAPVLRGVTSKLRILCLYFGLPDPQENHQKVISGISELYDDIHVVIAKNRIELASASVETSIKLNNVPPVQKIQHHQHSQKGYDQHLSHSHKQQQQHDHHQQQQGFPVQKFKLPFRVPVDPLQPPMSMSMSTENSLKTSGTVGGYIYPKIDIKKQPNLKSYAASKFALSCGHVCLDPHSPSTYPNIAVPSAALIGMYKQALLAQYERVKGSMKDTEVAYKAVLGELEEMFPPKNVKVNMDNIQERELGRNLPRHKFGQIIWGERTLIEVLQTPNAVSGLTERKLSDLAIIKVNKHMKCSANYLGDDVLFNEYDPSLIFENLYVRKVLNLKRYEPKPINEAVKDIDSQVSSFEETENLHGLEVFKYGSTTKYTRGNLNGIKLVYWLDGEMHSLEFIVNSSDMTSVFASGGDSGSWIMSKLQDINPNEQGLGVLGMLHSYDGEFKQFGLFTPMCEILSRLKEVTNIEWGIVGAQDYKGEGRDGEGDENEDEYLVNAGGERSNEYDSDVE